MEQLLLHLLGDYVTQTDKMAAEKTRSLAMAFVHAGVYGLPFLLLNPSTSAFFVIVVSHALIDRYRLARYVVFLKNAIHDPELRWQDCKETGYPSERPAWLAVWLLIVADNILHLLINYSALRWL